jgi:hypothetical protein
VSFASYTADVLQEAERLKQEGNNHFRSKVWEEALAQYRSALGHLPGRQRESPRESVEPPEPPQPEEEEDKSSPETRPATLPFSKGEDSPEITKARAVLNANIAACYVQLVCALFGVTHSVVISIPSQGEHKKVVEACTEGATSLITSC